jgi:hypothetical protein
MPNRDDIKLKYSSKIQNGSAQTNKTMNGEPTIERALQRVGKLDHLNTHEIDIDTS